MSLAAQCWLATSLLICLINIPSCAGFYQEGTVYLKGYKAQFVPGTLDTKNGAAYGFFNDTLQKTGWGVFEVKAGYGPLFKNNFVMYAAGYLEGYLTQKNIWNHYHNLYAALVQDKSMPFKQKITQFFSDQEAWAIKMVKKNPSDPYWRHVGYVLSQFDGLYDGYRDASQKDGQVLPRFAFHFLNGVGDYIDLRYALDPSQRPDFKKMSKSQIKLFLDTHGHCSALIKVTGALENIYMSHSSWFLYAATSRIYKHYDFNVNDQSTAAKKSSFSSYPGFLESLDDFYLLSSKLVMIQTTNSIFNMTLYNSVKPQSLMAWQRVRLSNMMANNSRMWGKYFSMYNSGTYNNQYMILDLKKVKLNEEIEDEALYIVEQIPGLVVYRDQTPILRTSHWPSYNVPFYEEIYNKSGYPEFVADHGLDSSYQLAPRAKIFRRDAGKVLDLDSMKKIMRYNDYKKDPYSDFNACSTICCRGDLNELNPVADGCYDTKVADFEMALNRTSHAINGPTRGTGLPPFAWTPQWPQQHAGLPNVYNFTFVEMKPTLN